MKLCQYVEGQGDLIRIKFHPGVTNIKRNNFLNDGVFMIDKHLYIITPQQV